MFRTMRQFLFGSALVVSTLFADLSVEQRVADFEAFWQSYKNAYVFFDLKHQDHGVNWDAAYPEFLKRIQNSDSDLELYRVVTEAQSILRDGHCYNGAFSKIRETERVYFQRVGLELVEGNRIVVSKVVPGSEFDKAGVQTGFELVQFDGKTIRQMAKEARKRISASSEGQFWSIFASSIYIYPALDGKPSSPKAQMVFKDLEGNLVEVSAKWNSVDPTGKEENRSAWVDEDHGVQLSEAMEMKVSGPLPISVRIFKDVNLAYVKIDSWMKTEDPIKQFEDVFKLIKDTDGMVLDLRGNGGGVGPWGILFTNYLIEKSTDGKKKWGWLSSISSEETERDADVKVPNDTWFERKLSKVFFRAAFGQLDEATINEIFTKPESMKYVLKKAFGIEISDEELMNHYKDGEFEPFYVNLSLNDRLNKIKPYTKPVYALTDGGCYSTTDICLTILKEFNRIKIVGTPNGAGSGSPIPFVLPNSGLQVYVPHAKAFPPHGTMIEGRPLKVDYEVTQTKEDLIKGKDTVLTEAVKLLLSQIRPGGSRFASEAISSEEGESVYNTIEHKEIDWGNLPTPDWAIQATLEQIARDALKLKK